MNSPTSPLIRPLGSTAAARCGGLLFLILSLRAPPVFADAAAPPVEPAFAEQYQKARAAYEEGRYQEAVEALLAAHTLRAEPRLLFNIAQTYRKAGDAALAKRYFAAYLDADKEIPFEKRAEVERYLLELKIPAQRLSTASPAAPRHMELLPRQQTAASAGVRDVSGVANVPRWSKVLGGLFIAGGTGLLASGATFLALDGQCTQDPLPPAIHCGRLYQTTAAGAAQLGVAGALWLSGVLTLTIPLARSKRAAPHLALRLALATH